MKAEEFIEQLQQGLQELNNNLAIVEAKIKELKLQRKTIRTQIANNNGAVAAAKKLMETEEDNESKS